MKLNHKENFVRIVDSETVENKIKKAVMVKPTIEQMKWQTMEMCAFIHFGMNTFTDLEWGDGTAQPSTFALKIFNAKRTVEILKGVGFKGIILTCKHHDGFCLWPSKYTDYTIAKSPYKNGEGDLVKELSEACKELNVKFGVYLSPWDRHEKCYGDSPKYNEYFLNQLTELLTNYGDIYEVWFDGACTEGKNGKIQEYDWNSYYSLIRKLQPDAVISIEGPDVRWVGNEAGRGREEEWSVVPGVLINEKLGLARLTADPTAAELASNNSLKNLPENTNCLYWSPAQVDVSIRQGWFYHKWMNNSIKSLYELVKIYDSSVGANASLLLNIPLDTEGNINLADESKLIEFGNYLKAAYSENLVNEIKKDELCGVKTFVVDLSEPKLCNCLVISENIINGQKISSYRIKAEVNGIFQNIASGKTIGYKKIIGFKEVCATKFYIEITGYRDEPEIKNIEVYNRPYVAQPPKISRDFQGTVSMEYDRNLSVEYSVNEQEYKKYTGPFKFDKSGTIKANLYSKDCIVATSEQKFGILKTNWTVYDKKGKSNDYIKYAKGESPYIILKGFPNEIIIDFGEQVTARGILYHPIDNAIDFLFNVFEIEISASINGKEFINVYKGKLDNIKNNPIPIYIDFNKEIDCKYLQFKAISGFDDEIVGIGAIDLI